MKLKEVDALLSYWFDLEYSVPIFIQLGWSIDGFKDDVHAPRNS